MSPVAQGREDRTLAERYNHKPGGFNAAVDAFEIPGEPEASIIVRRICRERAVWPEQLLGYARARSLGAAEPGVAPLSSGRCDEPSRHPNVVLARRLVWRGIYHGTDMSIENIAELFGYSPATVRPWAMSWRPFERSEGATRWLFWGLALADSAGVPLEETE